MKTTNNDTGSLFVGSTLPTKFQVLGAPSQPLFLQITGEAKPRQVTYIMGSVKKGWHLCSKGTGKFEIGEVEYEFIND